jgi:hypothetical protein
VTVTDTIRPSPTTITYAIDHGSTTVKDFELTPSIQDKPVTLYTGGPRTVVTAKDPLTFTSFDTPTKTFGPLQTVSVGIPAGFTPIGSSLPQGSLAAKYLQRRDANAGANVSAATACATFTKTVTVSASRVTASTVTTLTGTIYQFYTDKYDNVGFSSIKATYTEPSTAYITGTLTYTIHTVATETTVTLPTQTTTVSATSVYAACATDNFVNVYQNSSSGKINFMTPDNRLLDTGGAFYSGEAKSAMECCVRSYSYPDIAYWQYNEYQDAYGQCVMVNATQSCNAAGTSNYTVKVYGVEQRYADDYGSWVTGNSGCWQVSGAMLGDRFRS